MEVRVQIDKRSIRDFEESIGKQVPYATAVALTRTAAQAKDRVKSGLPRKMTIRNKFTSGSIRHERALKRDWPSPYSVVGSIAPYMQIQEEGGSKLVHAKAASIPKGIRTAETRVVPRSKWPGQLLQRGSKIPMGGRPSGSTKGRRAKPTPFLLKEKNGVGIYIRKGRKTRQLKRLYRLSRQPMKVKGSKWLEEPAMKVISSSIESNFVKALDEALSTSRGRS